MGTRTQHWESFCLWLPIQTGQDLKSEVENDCWVANFWDLANPKETHHWFCTLSPQKLSFQCSQETFSPLIRTWAGFSWEMLQITIFWKDTIYFISTDWLHSVLILWGSQHPQHQGLETQGLTGLQHIQEPISKTCLRVYGHPDILHPDRDITHPENNVVTQLFLEFPNLSPAP